MFVCVVVGRPAHCRPTPISPESFHSFCLLLGYVRPLLQFRGSSPANLATMTSAIESSDELPLQSKAENSGNEGNNSGTKISWNTCVVLDLYYCINPLNPHAAVSTLCFMMYPTQNNLCVMCVVTNHHA